MNNSLQLLTTKNLDGIYLDCYVEQGQEHSGDFWATREQIGLLLGYANPRISIANIHNRNKNRLDKFSAVINLITPSGTQATTVYNFKGLLEICRYSNQPFANQVIDKLWEIADEIRRTGMYLTDKAANAYLHNPALFEAMAQRCSVLERKVLAMEQKLNQQYPIFVLGETVLGQTGAISFQEGAHFLSQHGIPMGQNRLYKYCRDRKLLCSRKGRQWNKPTQKAMDAGLFNLQVYGGFNTITLITPEGLKFLTDELITREYPLLAMMNGQDTHKKAFHGSKQTIHDNRFCVDEGKTLGYGVYFTDDNDVAEHYR